MPRTYFDRSGIHSATDSRAATGSNNNTSNPATANPSVASSRCLQCVCDICICGVHYCHNPRHIVSTLSSEPRNSAVSLISHSRSSYPPHPSSAFPVRVVKTEKENVRRKFESDLDPDEISYSSSYCLDYPLHKNNLRQRIPPVPSAWSIMSDEKFNHTTNYSHNFSAEKLNNNNSGPVKSIYPESSPIINTGQFTGQSHSSSIFLPPPSDFKPATPYKPSESVKRNNNSSNNNEENTDEINYSTENRDKYNTKKAPIQLISRPIHSKLSINNSDPDTKFPTETTNNMNYINYFNNNNPTQYIPSKIILPYTHSTNSTFEWNENNKEDIIDRFLTEKSLHYTNKSKFIQYKREKKPQLNDFNINHNNEKFYQGLTTMKGEFPLYNQNEYLNQVKEKEKKKQEEKIKTSDKEKEEKEERNFLTETQSAYIKYNNNTNNPINIDTKHLIDPFKRTNTSPILSLNDRNDTDAKTWLSESHSNYNEKKRIISIPTVMNNSHSFNFTHINAGNGEIEQKLNEIQRKSSATHSEYIKFPYSASKIIRPISSVSNANQIEERNFISEMNENYGIKSWIKEDNNNTTNNSEIKENQQEIKSNIINLCPAVELIQQNGTDRGVMEKKPDGGHILFEKEENDNKWKLTDRVKILKGIGE